MHETDFNHKQPHSSLPCTKSGAGDALVGTKMEIMTNKRRWCGGCLVLCLATTKTIPGLQIRHRGAL